MGTFTSPRFENAVQRRVVGRWQLPLILGLPVLGIVCGLAITVVAQIASDGLVRMAVAVVLVTVAIACIQAILRSLTKKKNQAWLARGVPSEIDYTFSILPEGLQLTSEVGLGMIRWPFINEIVLFDDHWLLIAAGYGFGIPRQSFSSEAEERTFLAALLDHLEPSARARSRNIEKLLDVATDSPRR
jgi:hypothetical protein